MVDEENLEALDFMLWMAGSSLASALTYTNQSTVICRARLVLDVFGADIERTPLGWYNRASKDLLKMERAIHQQFRFRGRRRLRLHVPFWSQRVLQETLPNRWISSPADPSHTCENPLDLLRGHVIDVCILTPTQLDDSAQDLLRIELYHSTIDLTVFGPKSRDELSPRGAGYEDLLADGHHFSFKLFGFLPRFCRQASRSWFQKMHPPAERQDPPSSDGPVSSLKVAFLTPEMRRTITTPFLVDSSHPRCYRESLVILKENAQQPRSLELLDAIQRVFSPSAAVGETLMT